MAGASGGNFGDFNSMFSGMSPGAYTASSGPITSASTYNTDSTTTTPTVTGFNGGGPAPVAGTGTPGTNIMGTPSWLNDYAASGATDMNSWFQQNVAGYGQAAPGMTPEQMAAGGPPANAAPLPADREAYFRQMDRAKGPRPRIMPDRFMRTTRGQPAVGDPFGGGGMGGGGMGGMGGRGLGPGAGPFRWQQGPPRLGGRR